MKTLPMSLSEATGVPFYRQVVDQVAELIRSGQLTAGSRLPSVRDLSRELLVSLITVRRAYADLEAAGLILRRQGQGTFVCEDVEAASRRRALEQACIGAGRVDHPGQAIRPFRQGASKNRGSPFGRRRRKRCTAMN